MAKKAESDTEFLLRINKMKEDSLKKIKNASQEYSKEYEDAKQQGQEVSKIFTEIEECEKIAEEFKKNPPIVISKHINGISVEYVYEDKYKEKVENLKKHHFLFKSAVKEVSIFAPTFKTIGNVYIKRAGKKLVLPQSSLPPVSKGPGMGSRSLDPNNHGFVLEDKDLVITENNSYFNLSDITTTDKHARGVFMYPNSQLEVKITKKESNREIQSMGNTKIPEVIKKNSSSKLIEYNYISTKLISGIFHIGILEIKKDANQYLEIASGYPKLEFMGAQYMMNNIASKEIDKMPAAFKAAYLAKTKLNLREKKLCEGLDSYIELCKDNSIVLFGTGQGIKNKKSGKIASVEIPTSATPDIFDLLAGKIIVKGSDVFSASPDSRTKAIMKNKDAVLQYNTISETIKEYELQLKKIRKSEKTKKPESKESIKEREKRTAELKEQLAYYKKVSDNDMVMATQMQLDELDPNKKTQSYQLDEGQILKMIEQYNKLLADLKPHLNSNFPSYSR